MTPVTLGAGDYVIGSYMPGWCDICWAMDDVNTAPRVTYVESRTIGGDNMPSHNFSVFEKGYFGPTFRYTEPEVVPEPALVRLPALLALGVFAWRRRQRA